jgi:hypothetical protein
MLPGSGCTWKGPTSTVSAADASSRSLASPSGTSTLFSAGRRAKSCPYLTTLYAATCELHHSWINVLCTRLGHGPCQPPYLQAPSHAGRLPHGLDLAGCQVAARVVQRLLLHFERERRRRHCTAQR